MAIAAEIDLQKEYVPFVYVSKEVAQPSRNRKAGYSLTYIPLLTDRECYFWATGYDRLIEKGSVFIRHFLAPNVTDKIFMGSNKWKCALEI